MSDTITIGTRVICPTWDGELQGKVVSIDAPLHYRNGMQALVQFDALEPGLGIQQVYALRDLQAVKA